MYVLLGISCILWYWRGSGGFQSAPIADDILVVQSWSGPYAIALGLAILFWEKYYSLTRTDKYVFQEKPVRGACYILSSIPAFAAYPTILPAAVAIACGIFNTVATKSGEVGIAKEGMFNENLLLQYMRYLYPNYASLLTV